MPARPLLHPGRAPERSEYQQCAEDDYVNLDLLQARAYSRRPYKCFASAVLLTTAICAAMLARGDLNLQYRERAFVEEQGLIPSPSPEPIPPETSPDPSPPPSPEPPSPPPSPEPPSPPPSPEPPSPPPSPEPPSPPPPPSPPFSPPASPPFWFKWIPGGKPFPIPKFPPPPPNLTATPPGRRLDEEEVGVAAEHATAAPAHQSQLQCMRVDAANTAVDECDRIEKLPLNCTKCEPGQVRRVPLVYHAVADTADPPPLVSINARANPTYRLNYHSDESAAAFVREWCGEQAHQAYRCLVPSAYRADLFRFCALHAQGGLYVDADIVALGPFETLFNPCAQTSMGHDYPRHGEAKQMKIIAGEPRSPIFGCMLDAIVHNVKQRACFAADPAVSRATAVTYWDTRMAAWPFTGMRTNSTVLAYEAPVDGQKHFWGIDTKSETYADAFKAGHVYSEECAL